MKDRDCYPSSCREVVGPASTDGQCDPDVNYQSCELIDGCEHYKDCACYPADCRNNVPLTTTALPTAGIITFR
jgi:hypothetical protein